MRRIVIRAIAWLALPALLGSVLGALEPVEAADVPAIPGPACQMVGPCWSTMATANGGQESRLTGVSCTSNTFCVAVGVSYDGTKWQTLAEEWNGVTWSTMPSVAVSSPWLSGVSCISNTFCVAVGSMDSGGYQQALAEVWNGSTWSTMPPAAGNGTGDFMQLLNGVSCVSSTFCVAVGQGNSSTIVNGALAEVWDGSAWRVTANPVFSSGRQFNGVSCNSSSFCMAVGDVPSETWNGSAWSETAPSTDPGWGAYTYPYFTGVSCTSPVFCMAVSYDGEPDQTVAGEWNGATWSHLSTPNPDYRSALMGVSCTTPAFCVAVGDMTSDENGGYVDWVTLAEQWNGSSWAVSSTPNPQPTASLNGVSCAGSPTFCVAVGLSQTAPGATDASTLAESYTSL